MRTKVTKIIPAVILTSHTMGLGVIRALGKMGVPIFVFYYEKFDFGYLSKYVQKKYFVPHPEKFEEQFIKQLVDNAPKKNRCLLIPVDDATVLIVSKYKNLLEKYFIVACTEFKVTNLFINKEKTYELAEKINIPAPKTLMPKSVHDLKSYKKSIIFPCLVKPSYSHRFVEFFGKKMIVVNNYEQMKQAYLKATEAGMEVLIQELIPGDDTKGYNYNSYFWNGEPLVDFTAEKVRLSPSNYGVPSVVKSCNNNRELRLSAQKLLKAMNFSGYSCTEFKKDERDGFYKLMEVNGRFNRSGLLSVKCGLNFPWIMYNHLVNQVKPNPSNYKSKIFWIDEFRDLHLIFCNHSKSKFSLIQFFRPYFGKNVFAVFDITDPLPFIKRCFDMIKKLFKGIITILQVRFIKPSALKRSEMSNVKCEK